MIAQSAKPEIAIAFDGGILQILQPKDIHDGYIDGLNDTKVNRFLVGVRLTKQDFEGVKKFVQMNLDDPCSFLFGIWKTGANKHCGTVRLYDIENIHRTAHVGICIFDRNAWGGQIGSRALNAVTKWAFSSLGLRWIEAGIYADNVASQKAFSVAGYEWICDFPDKYLFDGKPAKVKIYAARNPI